MGRRASGFPFVPDQLGWELGRLSLIVPPRLGNNNHLVLLAFDFRRDSIRQTHCTMAPVFHIFGFQARFSLPLLNYRLFSERDAVRRVEHLAKLHTFAVVSAILRHGELLICDQVPRVPVRVHALAHVTFFNDSGDCWVLWAYCAVVDYVLGL